MKCKTCIRSPNENFDMPLEFYKSIINQLHYSRFGTQQIDLTGVGEPLLSPNIMPMVKHAKNKGFRVGFTTNFTLITGTMAEQLIKLNLDYLYMSIDSPKKETFEKIRTGTKFEDIISKIRTFVQAKKKAGKTKPILRLNVTISRYNLTEIPALIKLAEDLELDNISLSRQIIPGKEHWSTEVPGLPSWKEKKPGKVSISRRAIRLRRPQPCVALKGCFVAYDGKVLPCNSLIQIFPRSQYGKVQMGDLACNSLRDIWFSSRYRKFRTKLAAGMRPPYCAWCPRPYQM
jgi:MoaA/NifB/PqqE/SkfB family radical SAM enzyme